MDIPTTKAYVVDTDYENHLIQVRIIELDGLEEDGGTPDEYLMWASYLCIPGIEVDFRAGDVVEVTFEDDRMEQPVILGYAKTGKEEGEPQRTYATLRQLTVTDKLVVPSDTTIGNTSYERINAVVDRCERCPFYYREGEFYTVNFWLHPAPFSGEPYATIYVPANNQSRIKTSEIPADPPMSLGFTFNGWYYKDPFGHDRLWNFNDNIYSDLDLYNLDYYTVTFMSGIQDNAIPLHYEYVLTDGFHRSGYCFVVGDVKGFDGWYYKDPFGHYLLWDFDKFVLRDTELYIFWKDDEEGYDVDDSSLLIFDLILDDGYSLWKIAFVHKDEPLNLDELFGVPTSTKSSGDAYAERFIVFRGWKDKEHDIEGIKGEWAFPSDTYTTRDNVLYAEYVDYEELYYAVATARAMGQNGYSDEAWTEFRAKLEIAIEARDQAKEGNLSQAEIDEAVTAINEAVEELKASLNN